MFGRKKKKSARKNLESFVNQGLMEAARPILENFNRVTSYYRCAMMEVETKLNVLNEEF